MANPWREIRKLALFYATFLITVAFDIKVLHLVPVLRLVKVVN